MAYTLIQRQVASNSTSIDFTNITTDYDEYLITMTNLQPVTDGKEVYFQVDTGSNTSYNQTITSNNYTAGQNLGDVWQLLEQQNGQQSGTAFQKLAYGAEAQSYRAWMGHSGFLRLYDPSDGTFMKHYQSIMNAQYTGNGTLAQTYCIHWASQGYFHTTTALTRIRFHAETGNLYTGIFSMYGLGGES